VSKCNRDALAIDNSGYWLSSCTPDGASSFSRQLIYLLDTDRPNHKANALSDTT
jgi:hypothetical protein